MTNNDVIELIRENSTAVAPDFLAKLDFEAVKEHRETIRSPKVKNYVMAAAIYAAACLVLVLAIPLIIGGRVPLSPTPGTAPVVTGENPASSGTESVNDPVLNTINVADIDRIYNGEDPDNYPDSVTLEEVEKIIAAVRKAYDDYDAIVLESGEVISTDAKKPDITMDDLPSLSEDDPAVEDYLNYIDTLRSIINYALQCRLPENAYCSPENVLTYFDPSFFVMDIENAEFDSATEMYNFYADKESYPSEYRNDMIIFEYIVRYAEKGSTGDVMLFPTQEEIDIWHALFKGDFDLYEPERITETAEFDGLRLSISVNKDPYSPGDEINATAMIENIGDADVALWEGYIGDYIDVRFYENGIEKPEYHLLQMGQAEAEQSRPLTPGQGIKTWDIFTPGNPSIDGATPASADSVWEIKAFVNYVTNVPEDPYNPASIPLEELKTGTVSIIVPHETDVPDETEPPVEPEPTGTTTVNAPEPPVEITTPKETDPPVTTPKETEPPVTTPKETEPVKEPTVYPDPYVSNRTERSITKTLYGCDYTITLDKSSYKPGETVRATVTLENKGDLTLHFSSGSGRDFLSNVKMYEYVLPDADSAERPQGIISGGNPILDSPTVIAEEDLKPGDKWTYTAECDTSLADPDKGWYYLAKIYFTVDGKPVSESLEIDVYHDIPEDTLASDPYTKLPSLDQFSTERIEERTNYFADVESATLYKNGTAIPLAKDDPKLVQFINFMTWSDEEPIQSHYIVGGFLEKEDYEAAKDTDFRLEIDFTNTAYEWNGYISLCQFDRAIVLRETVLLIDDQDEPNYEHIGYIDEYSLICTGWFPYADHFEENDPQFDILTYAGFNNITAE